MKTLLWPAAFGSGLLLAVAFASSGSDVGHWPAAANSGAATTSVRAVWFIGDQPQPATLDFLASLQNAEQHGLDPSHYAIDEIELGIANADASTRAATERLLSSALVAYARDLRIARAGVETIYIDRELVPTSPSPEMLWEEGSPADTLRSLHKSNPHYEQLRAGLVRYRQNWAALPDVQIPHGPSLTLGTRGDRIVMVKQRLGLPSDGPAAHQFDAKLGKRIEQFRDEHGLTMQPIMDDDTVEALNKGSAHYERIIAANLDRLRGLPLGGRRYVLVDTVGAQISLIERGQVVDTMRAVVGKPGMETPQMAAFIRYAVINPYWNVPPDLVQNSIAPQVLREGLGVLAQRRFILSPDWQSDLVLDPAAIDWTAVAQGRNSVWVRQLPGGRNMMGAVKFMLPNDLGIYLHDTPDKSLFLRENRRLSSGCVRVEDAGRLATWLFEGREVLNDVANPDTHLRLSKPTPVFITYLTAEFVDGRILFKPDIEQREQRSRNMVSAASDV